MEDSEETLSDVLRAYFMKRYQKDPVILIDGFVKSPKSKKEFIHDRNENETESSPVTPEELK